MLTNKMETFELFHSKGVVKSARECSRNLGQRFDIGQKGYFFVKKGAFYEKRHKKLHQPPSLLHKFFGFKADDEIKIRRRTFTFKTLIYM